MTYKSELGYFFMQINLCHIINKKENGNEDYICSSSANKGFLYLFVGISLWLISFWDTVLERINGEQALWMIIKWGGFKVSQEYKIGNQLD